MPVHNTEEQVANAAQSVLAQTYENLELICIVNDSSDSSEEILLELSANDSRLVVISNGKGAAGAGPARNQGVALAKGEFISFVDDDDYVEADFLSRLYKTLIEHNVDMVQCAIRYIFKTKSKNKSYGSGIIRGEQVSVRIDMSDGFARLYPMVCGKLYKKELFDDIEMKAMTFEDIEFTPRLLERVESAFILDEQLYNYNKRYSTVTGWGELKRSQISEYLDSIFQTLPPYYTESACAIRAKYGLKPPTTVFANINNFTRGLNRVIFQKSPEFQSEFKLKYVDFVRRVEDLLSEEDWQFFSSNLVEPLVLRKDFWIQKKAPTRFFLKRITAAKSKLAKAFSSKIYVRWLEPYLYWVDFIFPKSPNIWLFSSWAYYPQHTLDNPRGIFEAVKDDPNIKKIVAVHGKFDENILIKDGNNVVFVPVVSFRSLYYILRAGVFFTGNALSPKFGYRNMMKHPKRRKLVQLWHAITLKKIGLTLDHNLELYWHDDANRYALITSTSDLDRQTMIESFSPKRPDAVVVTGVPRHDLLHMPEEKLPVDYREQIVNLRARKGSKKLFLYAPTWRGPLDDKSEFTIPQLEKLDALFESYNALFGQRIHLNNRKTTKRGFFTNNVLDLNSFPETTLLLREVDGLITDYSSIYFDIMQRDKPVVLYQPDIESYEYTRGLAYKSGSFRPHEETIDSFEKLYAMLEMALSGNFEPDQKYKDVKSKFMTFCDDKNALRVIAAMRKSKP